MIMQHLAKTDFYTKNIPKFTANTRWANPHLLTQNHKPQSNIPKIKKHFFKPPSNKNTKSQSSRQVEIFISKDFHNQLRPPKPPPSTTKPNKPQICKYPKHPPPTTHKQKNVKHPTYTKIPTLQNNHLKPLTSKPTTHHHLPTQPKHNKKNQKTPPNKSTPHALIQYHNIPQICHPVFRNKL